MSSTPNTIASSLRSRVIPPVLCPAKAYSPDIQSRIGRLPSPPLVKAVLHLANDDIWAAHQIVEDIHGSSTSNLLHSLVHKKEGDYWNSNYWIQRTSHPLFTKQVLKSSLAECEKAGKSSSGGEVEQRQWEEMMTVMDWVIANES